jgi:tetratricopeptide (TPR) repeat protein
VSFPSSPSSAGQPTARRLRISRYVGVFVLAIVTVSAAGWWYHSTRPDVRLRRGLAAVRADDLSHAEQYAELLRDAGDEDRYHLLAGQVALKQNQWRKALSHAAVINLDGPVAHEAALLKAHCLISLRQPRLAADLLLHLLGERADLADAHRYLAGIYYDQVDLIHAVPHLEEVTKLDPKDARAPALLGRCRRDREEHEQAVDAYREAFRRDPHPRDEDQLRIELAESLMKLRKEDEVISEVAGMQSKEATAIRAEAMIGLGREAEALVLLDQGLKEHPEFGGYLRLRGERYLAAGQPDKALPLLEKMVAQVPDDFRARTSLALSYERLGRTKEAEEQNKKVKAVLAIIEQIHTKEIKAMEDTWDPAIRMEIAELYEKIHRPSDAKTWRQAAESAAPGPNR